MLIGWYKQQQQHLMLLPLSFVKFSLSVLKINNTLCNDVNTVIVHNNNNNNNNTRCGNVMYCKASNENVRLDVSNMKHVCIRFDNKSLMNVKHITINARCSHVTLSNNINLSKTNMNVVSHKSVINCNNTINVNKFIYDNSLSMYKDNVINIKELLSNELNMKIGKNDYIKCNITKISENSVIDFPNINNINLKINRILLYTLLNVYDAKHNVFINLPLGVLGSKIGSTSFPTLILHNNNINSNSNNKPLHISLFKHNIPLSLYYKVLTISSLLLYITITTINNNAVNVNEVFTKYKMVKLSLYKYITNITKHKYKH